MIRRIAQAAVLAGLVLSSVQIGRGEDWPTYRHDERRSGVSGERMGGQLSAKWVFIPGHGPAKAWGDPQPKRMEGNLELPRLRFDDAFHVAADGKMVYFGSSSDNTVYALDAASGEIRWQFATGGPVRLAPTLAKGKLYVGSDDGKAYCLDARNGAKLWSHRAAGSEEMVLGNGRMISRWPVRTGVVVAGGIAYFGAGVFPADGQYLCALDAASGEVIWTNDTYAFGGRGGVTPQGYLLANKDTLFVPSGRARPAVFSRETGAFLYQKKLNWRQDGLFGGTYCALAGDLLFNGTEQMVAFYTTDPRMAFTENARRWIVTDKTAYLLTGKEVAAYDRAEWVQAKRAVPRLNGQIMLLAGNLEHSRRIAKYYRPAAARIPELEKQLDKALAEKKSTDPQAKWRTACAAVESILLTRDVLFAGGDGVVTGFDAKTGEETWSGKVNGRARGLAVADGRLLVSTDTGSIHCFVTGDKANSSTVKQTYATDVYPPAVGMDLCAGAAQSLVKESGITRGYALILGVGDGRFAYELAKRTELMIYVVDSDEAKVTQAREKLAKAGLLGSRIVVRKGPLEALPYSDYFANLVACPSESLGGKVTTPPAELLRVLKPCGGMIFAEEVGGKWAEGLKEVLTKTKENETIVAITGKRLTVTRGPLPGAGKWSHQHASAANIACSDDRAVRGPLGVLWYGEPGPGRMPNRHSSPAAPLAVNGRMFIQGENVIFAYDAYNGLKLWEREIPGAERLYMKTGAGNLAADDKNLFVAIDERCLRLDQATGKTLKTYHVPPSRSRHKDWEFLACVDGMLVGSRSRACVFGVDIATGEQKWKYDVKEVSLTSICLGDGKVFFVARGASEAQRSQAMQGVSDKARVDRKGQPIGPDVRLVVALDLKTGDKVWVIPQYVSDCVVQITRKDKVEIMGDITAMYAKGVLLLCGQPWNGHFWKEFFSGGFSRRSLIALDGDDGNELWSDRIGYRSRPLVVGDTIIAEPWAHDLRSGEPKMRTHPITGVEQKWQIARPGHHCGTISAGQNVLLFRSGSAAYYDLVGDYGTAHFGGQRPGCWLNAIAANGLVMLPEASSGCVCPYSVHCTMVFAPQRTNRVWGMFSAPGEVKPVKHLAVNLGAPGDRKDSAGALWLGYPRPRSDRLVINFRLFTPKDPGGGWYRKNANFMTIAATDKPWLFASGATGLTRCTIPLAKGADAAPRKYTVRLYFAETDEVRPGQRVFDVAIEGEPVLKDFDIAASVGVNKAYVKEIKGVSATNTLDIALTASKGLTILSALEVIAED